MAGDRERLGKRGEPKVGAVREPVERERGDCPGVLERPRGVDAEKSQVAADVAEPSVGDCLALGVERPHDHAVADPELVHAGPELGHRSRHLVPDHLWRVHTVVHMTVRNVQVGAADPAIGDVQASLARAGPDGRSIA